MNPLRPPFSRRLSAAAALLALLFATGCAGYRLGPVKPTYMQGVNSIAVPTFRNLTLIPRIEVLVSDTVIRQIQEDGTYKVASSDESADAVLEGEITQVLRRPGRTVIGDVQATEEFEMQLTVHYRVIRRATGEVTDDKNAVGTTSFFVSGDVNQDERQAIPLAAQSVASRIVSDIGEGW
ncbi:MAG TPA: LptE family protein [Chthoniobacteraceae bacterium]|nr:LptE family protein [Chthoniobacteraceae bacterium]